ncbi:MalY/PatB family protein [Clostridium sp.]|uniref:MalY/PatB family protein n=1 Tax=Clostridium sp. TaxID=1506 RepID=UPI002FC746F8
MYNFEELLNRNNNGSMKWNIDYIRKRFPETPEIFYPFFIADMDYKLPEEILDSFNKFIQEGDFGYFNIQSTFNESIINWYKNIYNINIKEEWLMAGIGTITTIKFSLSALLNKGDGVVVFTPVYGPFRDVVNSSELNLIQENLILDGEEYKIDFDSLEKTIKEKNIKSILFCNPHNPSGRVWRRDELNRIVEICKENSLLLIGDEVHSDLTLDGEFISLATFFDEYENILISSSPNKSFNLAGLNASYLLCADGENYKKIALELSKNKLSPNRIGINFLTICYTHGARWVKELKINIIENINLAKKILENSEVEVITPKAGYLLWVKLNKVSDIDVFTKDLAKNTGVLLEPGSRFVANYDGYVRINLATSKEKIKNGLEEFVKYYDNI